VLTCAANSGSIVRRQSRLTLDSALRLFCPSLLRMARLAEPLMPDGDAPGGG
jgi:hypothetical protein